jgi:predicted outer membrane protein
MPLWQRKLVLLAGAALAALCLRLLANAFDLSDGATLALAGAGLALLVVFGSPWAFNRSRRVFEYWNEMEAGKAAIATGQEHQRYARAYAHYVVIGHGLEQQEVVPGDPLVDTAARARRDPASFSKRLSEPIEVGHDVPILELDGSRQ